MTLLLQLTATYNLSADGLSWDNINFMVCLWNSLHIVTIFSINLFFKKKFYLYNYHWHFMNLEDTEGDKKNPTIIASVCSKHRDRVQDLDHQEATSDSTFRTFSSFSFLRPYVYIYKPMLGTMSNFLVRLCFGQVGGGGVHL